MNDYCAYDYTIHYWRTVSGLEVDFVLYGERGILAFEVKRSDRLRPDDLNGLKAFLADYPEAKAYLLFQGTSERHDSGIEIRNYDSTIRALSTVLANGGPLPASNL